MLRRLMTFQRFLVCPNAQRRFSYSVKLLDLFSYSAFSAAAYLFFYTCRFEILSQYPYIQLKAMSNMTRLYITLSILSRKPPCPGNILP